MSEKWKTENEKYNGQNVSHAFVVVAVILDFSEKFNSNSFCVTLGDKNDKNTCFVTAKIYYLPCALAERTPHWESVGRNSIQIRQ